MNENNARTNRDSYLKKPIKLNITIEETMPEIITGIKYDLIFSEKP